MNNQEENNYSPKDTSNNNFDFSKVQFQVKKVRKKIHDTGFLNSFSLKLLAIIIMTIDHIGVSLGLTYSNGSYYLSGLMSYHTYTLCRNIGRLAFPIFCYMIVEGLFYTKDILNYVFRLFAFALISQVPFSLMTKGTAFDFNKHLNVYFTLAFGLITIALIDYFKKKNKHKDINKPIFYLLSFVTILCSTSFADTIGTDYGSFGVLVIVIFYVFRDKPLLILVGLYFATRYMSNSSQMYALWALVPILLHNHKKGPSMKYAFYAYYPLHMLILYFISQGIA